jgi:hypothetical protein
LTAGGDGQLQVLHIESPYIREDEYALGTHCELIAISEGRASRHEFDQPFDEMERVSYIKRQREYVFYNVLWITRVRGIAYRKAIGRVWKEAWTRQIVKVVTVVLG